MVEKLLAVIGLVACLVLLLGMAIGPARRRRVQALFDRVRHWRRHRDHARQEAAQAIERARRAVERDGNVYRPKSFGKRPPDDTLH